MKKIIIVQILVLLSFGLISCEEEDDNKLSKAQECLDNLTEAATNASALLCESHVAGLTSPESYLIRCSVRFFVGGVRDTQIAQAFDDYQNEPDESLKPGILMAAMIHTTSEPPAGNALANSELAASYCKKSLVPSLDYIASLSYVGTTMSASQGGSTDPAVILANCSAMAGNCDDAAIGTALISMADVYCVGDAADNSVCSSINAAISAGGGDPEQTALALYNLLQ